jgi:hypothetical protein
MPPRPRKPRWFWIPLRVLLMTLLLMFLSFAITLFLAILGVVAWAALHHTHPNMTLAYRHFALPVALTVGAATLVATTIFELRQYRQAKVLAAIERAG